jgi:demethylmenaquinone methyltransferase/2-methoxy-6-polyprenyl-1,4-benzoquinol methylase
MSAAGPFPFPGGGPDRAVALERYRRLATSYDASCSNILGVRAAAIDALRLAPGDTVIDVACGTGPTLVELHARVGAAGKVIGVEQSPEMSAVARTRLIDAGIDGQVDLLTAPVEDAPLVHRADALLFCYTHDVLQNRRAIGHLMRHAKPGARVAVTGCRFVSWWWGAPLNLFTALRARNYLTTLRGMRRPWLPLRPYCPDIRVLRGFHLGSSYLAVGEVDRRSGTGAM